MTTEQYASEREHPPTIHELKTWDQFWPQLVDGSKTFEARKDDRAFRVGDILRLRSWNNNRQEYSGRQMDRTITYKLSGPAWGVEEGYCILGLSPLVQQPDAGEPIPMIIHCPDCLTRHVDAGEFATKPHHTHSCQQCGLTWRPAVVPTVGVQFLPWFKDQP